MQSDHAEPPMTDLTKLAESLTVRQRAFFLAVCRGEELCLADRPEDRARQAVRRKGLVFVDKNPRRWEPTDLGLALRAHLENTDAAS